MVNLGGVKEIKSVGVNLAILLFSLIYLLVMGCTSKHSYPSYKTLKTFQMKAPQSEVVEMEHKKSGAKIVLLKNADTARTFAISFRTPPYDDTGLFHIFEHAVLAGSRLYPSKSNFFNVSNSSVATFINAMTDSVSTIYPFVTKDPKDFDNLLSVYMDAVFFPKTITDPRIVKREGWRYEVDPKTKKMSINGIVLSEMKGHFSNYTWPLWYYLGRTLMPKTPYSYDSGGLPEKVATLTFDQIVSAHKKYYHPQNSIIFLYGDIDYKKTLAEIDRKFLSHFDKSPDFVPPEILQQTDFNYPTPVVEATYEGTSKENQDFVAKGYVMGKLPPLQKDSADILMQALVSGEASPVKIRILREGLARTVFAVHWGGDNNAIAVVFRGSRGENRKKLEQILDEEIDKVIKDGIEQELLISTLNEYEFSLKEKFSNKGMKGFRLFFNFVLGNWLYPDTSLQEILDYQGYLKKLRVLLSDQNFIKDLFKKYFRDNTRTRWLVMKPDPQFSQKLNAKLDDLVNKALEKKSLSEYEKEDQEFRKWVAEKESREIIGKTPLLDIADIKPDEKPISSRHVNMGTTKLIEYPQGTGGISYINLFFDLKGIKEENLKKLDFFTNFIKKTNTKNYSFQELSKQIGIYAGEIDFHVSSYQSRKNTRSFKPTLKVKFSFLNENQNEVFGLVKELLTEAQFAPSDRLDALVKEMKTRMAGTVAYRARGLAMRAASKNFFPALGAFKDELNGGAFEEYILKAEIDPGILSSELKILLKNIFNQKRLYLATITTSEQDMKRMGAELRKFKEILPRQVSDDQTWSFRGQNDYDGYAIPGEVQYTSQVASYREQGLDYTGAMKVYASYVTSQFLYPRLREQLGAYAAWFNFDRNGLLSFSSYKDPNLRKSFDSFLEALEFMKKEDFDQEKLKASILGSLKPYYADKGVIEKVDFMTYLYLVDLTWDEHIQTKKEVLGTSPEDFKKITGVLEKALKGSKKAVSGNSDKIKKEAPFLKRILSFL